jgi:cyclopropane fatty-acyl-phospholipid synthase-like methyltransferase
MTAETYDREYFEDGLANGKSLYNGFTWMPERSLKEAVAIIDSCNVSRKDVVLDFGTAKGFLVKAFRILGRKAYGCDISRYAICTADTDTRQYLKLSTPNDSLPFDKTFDLIIAKDVFEHMHKDVIAYTLAKMRQRCRMLFVVVPLGRKVSEAAPKHDVLLEAIYEFVVPEYRYDSTHVIARPIEWWKSLFEEHMWTVLWMNTRVEGIKDNWSHYPDGNAFFCLTPPRPVV